MTVGVRSLLAAGAVGALWILVGCSALIDDEQTAVPTDVDVHDELVDGGQPADVADCVVRLAEDQIDRNTYDAVLEAELISACVAARATLDGESTGGLAGSAPQNMAFAEDEPYDYGDDPTLDRLWDACQQGSGQACDDLFSAAPFNSGYEDFGLSCGDRPDILRCTDLDQLDEGPIPEVYLQSQDGDDT